MLNLICPFSTHSEFIPLMCGRPNGKRFHLNLFCCSTVLLTYLMSTLKGTPIRTSYQRYFLRISTG